MLLFFGEDVVGEMRLLGMDGLPWREVGGV